MPFTLPSRADSSRLRALAKSLIAAIRTGDAPSLVRLRLWFADATAVTAKLSQAQTTMAREFGYPSWTALIAEVERRAQKRRERIARKEAALGDIAALAEQWFTLAEAGDLDRLWRAMGVAGFRMERTRDLMLRSPERHSRFIDVLIQGLEHPKPRARFEYAHILDSFGDQRSIEPLKRLMDDETPKVRWMAMHALSCHACNPDTCPDDPVLLARIADHARHDESITVRRQATAALGLSRNRAMEPILREILATVTDDGQRRAAQFGLKELYRTDR